MALTISNLAGRAGVSTDTLRYYERIGLIEPSGRSAGGYRMYDDVQLGRLQFIKNAQHMGLRLSDIKELLEIMDRGACPCGHTAAVVGRRLAEVDAELSRLRSMRRELVGLRGRTEACTEVDADDWWCCSPDPMKGG